MSKQQSALGPSGSGHLPSLEHRAGGTMPGFSGNSATPVVAALDREADWWGSSAVETKQLVRRKVVGRHRPAVTTWLSGAWGRQAAVAAEWSVGCGGGGGGLAYNKCSPAVDARGLCLHGPSLTSG